MVRAGLQPKLVKLLASFPSRPEPYEVSLVRFSDEGDVAPGQLSPAPKEIMSIPIHKPPPQGSSGEAVVTLGYPAGGEGVLARLEDKTAVALLKGVDHHLRKLVHDITGQGGIRPLVTQGTSVMSFPIESSMTLKRSPEEAAALCLTVTENSSPSTPPS